MKISTRTRYGVRAMSELAIYNSKDCRSVGFMAKTLGISKYYLENLMLVLKQNGLVVSNRGPKGGYALAKHPADINLTELFIALEGSDTLIHCINCYGHKVNYQ